MKDYLLTVDIGTTSTKTLAFTKDGEILSRKSISYKIITPEIDFSEQDPDEILSAIKDSMKEIVEEVEGSLIGVSFSSAMHSLILMDKNDVRMTNSIIWADNRSSKEAETLKISDQGLSIYLNTGTPIHPMSPLCKIAWFKSHEPQLFQKAKKFISIKEYVFFKFFGRYIIDHSIASATGLFDIFNLRWFKESLEYLEVSENKLSEPVPTDYVIRGLKPEIQKYLKINDGIPFVIGGSDGCLANLGADSIKPGHTSITIGTSGAIRMACKSSTKDNLQRIFNYRLDKDTFIIGGPINNGAVVLDWFRNNFFDDESELKTEEKFNLKIENDIVKIPPGAEGLIFLPYLFGERAPIWDPEAKGVFFGVKFTHHRDHFLRSLMEGVIFSLYSIGRVLEELVGEIKVINAGGGFANSRVWVQMMADVFNKKVIINNSLESSSIGAAMIGFKALKVFEEYEQMGSFVKTIVEFYPDPEKHLQYHKSFEVFESLYRSLKEEFRKI